MHNSHFIFSFFKVKNFLSGGLNLTIFKELDFIKKRVAFEKLKRTQKVSLKYDITSLGFSGNSLSRIPKEFTL